MKLYDTNEVINHLQKGESKPGKISIITLIELLRGVQEEKRLEIKTNLEELYQTQNLTNNIILTYCKLYTSLKTEGTLIPDADLLIAATTIANEDVLVTNDTHFQRLKEKGLKIEK